MGRIAEKSDPALWQRVKAAVQRGAKGGAPGQWSARKAQLAVQEYKRRGGGYVGPKRPDNSLRQWEREDWGTRSGKPSRQTGERYLPKRARAALSPDEYRQTSDKKRADTRKGRQFSAQPKRISAKAAAARLGELTRAALMERARAQGVRGRSRMRKSELIDALTL